MFRFSIRELLILTVTLGLAVGWWLDRRRSDSREKAWQRQVAEALVARDEATNQTKIAEERGMATQIQRERRDESGVLRPNVLRPVPGTIDESPLHIPSERRRRDLWREYPELFDEPKSEPPSFRWFER